MLREKKKLNIICKSNTTDVDNAKTLHLLLQKDLNTHYKK